MTKEYDCPVCHESFAVPLSTSSAKKLRCPSCHELLRFETDAEFIPGAGWRDLSKLVTYRSHWDE